MKDLIKKEVIVALITIILFAVIFTLLNGWSTEGAERLVKVVFVIITIIGIGVATLAGVVADIADSVTVSIVGGFIVIAFIVNSIIAAGGSITLAIGFGVDILIFLVAGLACGVAVVFADTDQLHLHKGKVILSLFIEMFVISVSISAMVFA